MRPDTDYVFLAVHDGATPEFGSFRTGPRGRAPLLHLSNGESWLERELRSAHADTSVDWIVVFMHHVAVSTADQFNGADLGVREQWLPLFGRYWTRVTAPAAPRRSP